MKENQSKTLKILIGVIIGLSTIILLSGVFYILNMQNKISKLEKEIERNWEILGRDRNGNVLG